jgi:hypothetical protein
VQWSTAAKQGNRLQFLVHLLGLFSLFWQRGEVPFAVAVRHARAVVVPLLLLLMSLPKLFRLLRLLLTVVPALAHSLLDL